MKKFGLILVAGFFALVASSPVFSQSEDPSDMFLKAYMTAQQGEKLEHEGQFGPALAKYRFAGSLLEDLKKRHGDWQPAIVEYRSRKVSENILRVQDKAATQSDLTAGPTPIPGAAPVLPEQSSVEPSLEVIAPRQEQPGLRSTPAIAQSRVLSPAPTPAATVNDAAIRDATKKLQGRVDELKSELDKSRERFSTLQKEKETLNSRL